VVFVKCVVILVCSDVSVGVLVSIVLER
jgi:hypothetical protein